MEAVSSVRAGSSSRVRGWNAAGQGGDLPRHAQDVGVAGNIGREGHLKHGVAHVVR